jgi:hypothetical protein
MQRVGPISATAVADFEMVPVMDVVGIERGESRGAAAELQYPRVLFTQERRRPSC